MVTSDRSLAQSIATRNFYDSSGQLYRAYDSTGTLLEYTYDASGNILKVTRSTAAPGSLAIFNITPQRAGVGAVLKIFGQGFSSLVAGDIVTINGVKAVVVFASDTEIDVLVPAGVSSGQVCVTVSGATACSGASLTFTYTPIPTITSVTPDGGVGGTVVPNVAVTGTDLDGAIFSFPAGATAVTKSTTATTATIQVGALVNRGIFPLVATTVGGSSTSSVTVGNHFIVMVSPDEANSQAITVLNKATTSLPNSEPTNVYNEAYSRVVSVLEQSPGPGTTGTTNGPNEADSYLVSLKNLVAGKAGFVNTAPMIRMEISNAIGGTIPLTSSAGAGPVLAGQSLRLQSGAVPKAVRMELSANGSLLEQSGKTPFTFVLNAPSSIGPTNLTVTARGADGVALASQSWTQKIMPDPGTVVHGRAVDATGTPVVGATITVEASGIFGEYFLIDPSTGRLPEVPADRATRRRLEAALDWPNPNGVFGPDPLGVPFPEYLAHYKAELMVPGEGVYRFALRTTGEGQISIDGTAVSGPQRLSAGAHLIEVTYLKLSGPGALELRWTLPNGEESTVPQEALMGIDTSLSTVSGATGEFSLPAVPAKVSQVRARAQLADGTAAESVWTTPVPGSTTDLGDVVITRK